MQCSFHHRACSTWFGICRGPPGMFMFRKRQWCRCWNSPETKGQYYKTLKNTFLLCIFISVSLLYSFDWDNVQIMCLSACDWYQIHSFGQRQAQQVWPLETPDPNGYSISSYKLIYSKNIHLIVVPFLNKPIIKIVHLPG